MKPTQKLPIPEGTIYEYDGLLVLAPYKAESFTVISENDGVYSIDFSVNKASRVNEGFQDIFMADCMDYKNGRLAVIGNCLDEDSGEALCDFYISVYDKSGLIYYGEYNNSLSLDTGSHPECTPIDEYGENSIQWQ